MDLFTNAPILRNSEGEKVVFSKKKKKIISSSSLLFLFPYKLFQALYLIYALYFINSSNLNGAFYNVLVNHVLEDTNEKSNKWSVMNIFTTYLFSY